MAKYLLEVNYSVDGIKGVQSEGGSARVAAATQLIEAVGGKVESFYFAFGDIDAYVIAEVPDNVSAAAAALTVCAGGGARIRTVALLSPADIDAAVARKTTYRPPGG
ncbi:MAG: GYD domain-containing protein [Gemmatimonadales bacterium]